MFIRKFENNLDMPWLLLSVAVWIYRFINAYPIDQVNKQFPCYLTDVRHAVADIMDYANIPDTPVDQHEVLKQAAKMIASFYGMEEELLGAA